MAEVDPVELAVEFSQIFAQGEVPQRAVVEALVARLELTAAGQRGDDYSHHRKYPETDGSVERHDLLSYPGFLHGPRASTTQPSSPRIKGRTTRSPSRSGCPTN